MSTDPWRVLRTELDLWAQSGRTVRLWLRDDDAVAPSPALQRLADLSERFALPVLLGIIPMLAEPTLPAALRNRPSLLPCQHGCWHRNHAQPGGKKSEFGRERPFAVIEAEIASSRARLDDLFGPSLLPVFVPPWNRIDPGLEARLPELGFSGLSCFRGFEPSMEGGPVVVNTVVDIMDWQGGRIGRTAEALAMEAGAFLLQSRLRNETDAVLGLLLHHRDHDHGAWSALDAMLNLFCNHAAVTPTDPRGLFSTAVEE